MVTAVKTALPACQGQSVGFTNEKKEKQKLPLPHVFEQAHLVN